MGRLIVDKKFRDAVKKNPDVVATVYDLNPEHSKLLTEVAQKIEKISAKEIIDMVAGSGHGINSGGCD